MVVGEFSSEWFSIENIDDTPLNFDELKECDWFNVVDISEKNNDNDHSNDELNLNSTTWCLTIRFKSVSLQNPATLLFTAPNWYKIIKGPNEISPSKCPKTNPSVPCRRSTTLFSDLEIVISSKIVCSWKDIFDRLNTEPLKIETHKVNPFGDQEIHSVGYVNLKHILIQPEKTNPVIINSYIYGKNSYRMWPTRVLLYPKFNKTDRDYSDCNDNADTDNDINNNVNKTNNTNEIDESAPIGLVEIDVILQDCEKQSISESNNMTIKKKSKNKTDDNKRTPNAKKESIDNNSSHRTKSRSPIERSERYSPSKLNVQPQIINEVEFPLFEDDIANYTENNVNSDLQYINFNQISEFRPKLDLFNPGADNLSTNILDSIKNEIKIDEFEYLKDTNDLIKMGITDEESRDLIYDIHKWKLIEKERFIEHLKKLEDEFRKITISRQEIIMRDLIENLNFKTRKIGKLENLVTEKIFKLKNKENSVDNINNENNKKIQALKYEHKKLLEYQKNDYIMKLDIEKKKLQLLESEKNKWIRKYKDLEQNMDKVFKELRNLKSNKKSELCYKNEISRKDELIQFQESQINQLKDTIELLKASRDHIKMNFEKFVSSLSLVNNSSEENGDMNFIQNYNIDSLIESGIYNENDEFIKYLKNK